MILTLVEMLAHLPKRGQHPAARNADETAGDHITEEVEIGADKPDGNGEDRERIKRPPRRIVDPQN